jgi:ABC-2 type transport system ATP-binding protein
MNTGSVVYHGSITALRERAPLQAHEITTTNDERAAVLAASQGLQVTRTDTGLAVRGPQDQIDALVTDLVADGIALRGLSRRETPLEALFFMLTEATPDTPTRDLLTAGAPR